MKRKDDRNRALLDAYRYGENVNAIAAQFGITRQRVCAIAHRSGLRRSKGRPRLPDMDAATLSHYVKLRNIMGSAYAREAMGLPA